MVLDRWFLGNGLRLGSAGHREEQLGCREAVGKVRNNADVQWSPAIRTIIRGVVYGRLQQHTVKLAVGANCIAEMHHCCV